MVLLRQLPVKSAQHWGVHLHPTATVIKQSKNEPHYKQERQAKQIHMKNKGKHKI